MICKVETKRFIMEIIPSRSWRKGEPINPKIPKWLVKVSDKFTHDEYFPDDQELKMLTSTMDEIELILFNYMLNIKERHNFANLKNPENRSIERYIHELAKEEV